MTYNNTKNYTIYDWRGQYTLADQPPPHKLTFNNNNKGFQNSGSVTRRRMQASPCGESCIKIIKKLIDFDKWLQQFTQNGEILLSIWSMDLWLSQLIRQQLDHHKQHDSFAAGAGQDAPNEPFSIIKHKVGIDLGFTVSIGFGVSWEEGKNRRSAKAALKKLDAIDSLDQCKPNEMSKNPIKWTQFKHYLFSKIRPGEGFAKCCKMVTAHEYGCKYNEEQGLYDCGEADICQKSRSQAYYEGFKCIKDILDKQPESKASVKNMESVLSSEDSDKSHEDTMTSAATSKPEHTKGTPDQPQSVAARAAKFVINPKIAKLIFNNNLQPPSLYLLGKEIYSLIDNIIECKDLFSHHTHKESKNNSTCNKGQSQQQLHGIDKEIAFILKLFLQKQFREELIDQVLPPERTCLLKIVESLEGLGMSFYKIYDTFQYFRHKKSVCDYKIKFGKDNRLGPIKFKIDLIIDLVFTKLKLTELVRMLSGFVPGDRRRLKMDRRRLQDSGLIPQIDLPCIVIVPGVNLCPIIQPSLILELIPSVNWELDNNITVDFGFTPSAAFGIDIGMKLSLGMPLASIDITFGIELTFVKLSLPVNFDVEMLPEFGLLGDGNLQLDFMDFNLHLGFEICAVGICFVQVTIFSVNIKPTPMKWPLFSFGLGSYAHKKTSTNTSDLCLTSVTLDMYFGFQEDAVHTFRQELLNDYLSAHVWEHDIWKFGCTIKGIRMSQNYTRVNVSTIDDCHNPHYEYDQRNYQSIFKTQITVEAYSQQAMGGCIHDAMQQMFNESLCCEFAFAVQKAMKIPFDIWDLKVIIFDKYGTFIDGCTEFDLSTKVRVLDEIYYDYPCAEEGWLLNGRFGYHEVIGGEKMHHTNGHPNCFNEFKSTVHNISREYEIEYGYDFMMIALKVWGMPSLNHSTGNYYAVMIDKKIYWIDNTGTGANCGNGWVDGTSVAVDQFGFDSSISKYCYKDVIIYLDLNNDIIAKYGFNIQMKVNIPANENWGFSGLLLKSMSNKEVCITGIWPYTEIGTASTVLDNINYMYFHANQVPSLYYGYLFFEIKLDYLFADLTSLITLSNSTDNTAARWVINFGYNDLSSIQLRAGYQNFPTTNVSTSFNKNISHIINNNTYTPMYIQWDADPNVNIFRVGFGTEFGEHVLIAMQYDHFGFGADEHMIYVGFTGAFNFFVTAEYKIFTLNVPSYCFTKSEEDINHVSNSFFKNCGDFTNPSSNLIFVDMEIPKCVYYINSGNAYNELITILDTNHYIVMDISLYSGGTAGLTGNSLINMSLGSSDVTMTWNPTNCTTRIYSDDVSNSFIANCSQSLSNIIQPTYDLSSNPNYAIQIIPADTIVTHWGFSDIELFYGVCQSIFHVLSHKAYYSSIPKYYYETDFPSMYNKYISNTLPVGGGYFIFQVQSRESEFWDFAIS
eukprot:324807_1